MKYVFMIFLLLMGLPEMVLRLVFIVFSVATVFPMLIMWESGEDLTELYTPFCWELMSNMAR